jgi:ABC-type multidrug transport system ATPase subunit
LETHEALKKNCIERPNFTMYLLRKWWQIKRTSITIKLMRSWNWWVYKNEKTVELVLFSLGMKQRLAIASALLNDLKFYFDFNGLDLKGFIHQRYHQKK